MPDVDNGLDVLPANRLLFKSITFEWCSKWKYDGRNNSPLRIHAMAKGNRGRVTRSRDDMTAIDDPGRS